MNAHAAADPDFQSQRAAPIMRMQWRHLLFMHWRCSIEELRPLVPEPFQIDTFDGSAWIGLVPFTMLDVSPVFLPRIPWRGVTDFHECNVRTYIKHGEDAGVYFFSLDAASRLGVWGAKTFYHLPYKFARMDLQRTGDEIEYHVDRIDPPCAMMHCRWRAGETLPPAQPGELAHFLTERYQLFTTDRRGRPRRCRIVHQPWPLRKAELLALDDELVRAAGVVVPDETPVLYHADWLDVRAGWMERARTGRNTASGSARR